MKFIFKLSLYLFYSLLLNLFKGSSIFYIRTGGGGLVVQDNAYAPYSKCQFSYTKCVQRERGYNTHTRAHARTHERVHAYICMSTLFKGAANRWRAPMQYGTDKGGGVPFRCNTVYKKSK